MKMNTTCIIVIASLFLLSSCSDLRKQGISCTDCRNNETAGHTFAYFAELVNLYTIQRFSPISEYLNQNTVAPMNMVQSGGVKEFVPATTTDAKASWAKEQSASIMLSDSVDSRSVWFSLDSLKTFICTIEKYNEGLVKKSDSLGIRFYFGVYSDTHNIYPGKHTLILVPTRSKVDFDPRYEFIKQAQDTSGTFSSSSIVKMMKKAVGKPLYQSARKVSLMDVRMMMALPDICPSNTCMNEGQLCPPCSSKCKHGIGIIQ